MMPLSLIAATESGARRLAERLCRLDRAYVRQPGASVVRLQLDSPGTQALYFNLAQKILAKGVFLKTVFPG